MSAKASVTSHHRVPQSTGGTKKNLKAFIRLFQSVPQLFGIYSRLVPPGTNATSGWGKHMPYQQCPVLSAKSQGGGQVFIPTKKGPHLRLLKSKI